jgi:serine phosphatase RsbU (regulator of sigma subunit)
MAQAATLRLIGPDRPELPGVDYAAGYWRIGRPAGQYYDLVSLPKGSLGLVLAEVGLQGLDAAIQVVQLQTLLRSRFQPYCDDLSELMESTQRALVSSYGGSAPVSLFVARYHPQTRMLHYVNAGHFAPFLLRFNDDGAEALRLLAKGNALCSPEPTPWAESEIQLRPSDVLGLASSGFPSTANEEGATFGEGRLIDALMSWTGRTAKDLVGLTLKSAEEFAGEQYDNPDRLLMVLKCE